MTLHWLDGTQWWVSSKYWPSCRIFLTTKQSNDVEQWQVVQIRLLSQQHARIFVLVSQTVSGGFDHHLQPILQHTIDHKHNVSPPPIRDLPNEGVWGLGSNNQQDVDVIEGVHSWCFPAPSCGGRHLFNISAVWLRSRKQILHNVSKQICWFGRWHNHQAHSSRRHSRKFIGKHVRHSCPDNDDEQQPHASNQFAGGKPAGFVSTHRPPIATYGCNVISCTALAAGAHVPCAKHHPHNKLAIPGTPQGCFNPSPPMFVAGGFNPGQGGRSNGGSGCGYGHCGCGHTPFTTHMATQGGGFQGAGRASFQDVGCAQYPAQQMNPTHSNVTKNYNNWNIYYSCGFGIEDRHTSSTCPWDWQKPPHIEGFSRANSQSYIEGGGVDCCTKEMHKNVFLLHAVIWHRGVEITYTWANEFNNLVSAYDKFLDPPICLACKSNEITVAASNHSHSVPALKMLDGPSLGVGVLSVWKPHTWILKCNYHRNNQAISDTGPHLFLSWRALMLWTNVKV